MVRDVQVALMVCEVSSRAQSPKASMILEDFQAKDADGFPLVGS
jgi:hypothetical protein